MTVAQETNSDCPSHHRRHHSHYHNNNNSFKPARPISENIQANVETFHRWIYNLNVGTFSFDFQLDGRLCFPVELKNWADA